MEFANQLVQGRARPLGNDLDAAAAGQVPDMAAEAEASTGAGYEVTEADALHAAADSCEQPLLAFGFSFHVRGARPVPARCGVVRDSGVRRPGG